MIINQLRLNGKELDLNKKFLTLLYTNQDFQESKKWFDYLDCSVCASRQQDSDMNLERFVNEMTPSPDFVLQLASPNPFEIRYCSSYHDLENKRRHFFLNVLIVMIMKI